MLLKYRNKYSAEDVKKRWAELSDLTKPTLHESANQASRSTVLNKVSAADGNTYGIVQESTKYFIKVANTNVDDSTSLDFKYIGGQANSLHERFDSYPAAMRRLSIKVASLRESFHADAKSENDDEEDSLLADLDTKVKEKDSDDAKIDTEITDDTNDLDDLMADMPDDLSDKSSNDALEIEDDKDELEADEEEETEDDEEKGGEKDPNARVQELMGELGVAIDGIANMPEPMLKNILNTIITKCSRGLADASDKTIEKLMSRIEKRGEKLNESNSEMLDEGDYDMDLEHGKTWGQGVDHQKGECLTCRGSGEVAGEFDDELDEPGDTIYPQSCPDCGGTGEDGSDDDYNELDEARDEDQIDRDYERSAGEEIHADHDAMEEDDTTFQQFIDKYGEEYPEDDDETHAQIIIDYLENFGSDVSEFCLNSAFDEFESYMTPEAKEMVMAAANSHASLKPFVSMLHHTTAKPQGLNESYLNELIKKLVKEEKKKL